MQKSLTSVLPSLHNTTTTRKSVHHVAYTFHLSAPLHDVSVPAWNACTPDNSYIHMGNSARQPDTIFYILLLIHIPSLSHTSFPVVIQMFLTVSFWIILRDFKLTFLKLNSSPSLPLSSFPIYTLSNSS